MQPSPPIKIFVDAHVFDDEFQGSRTFVREIYRELAKKPDIRVYLAAFDVENLKKQFPGFDNIEFLQFKSRSGVYRLLFDIPAMVKKHEIDYAHFQYIVPPVKRCKFIVTIHDVIFNDYPEEFSTRYRLVKKFLYRQGAIRADILTTVSEFSKTSIAKHLGVHSPVHVIPNGVSDKFFEPYDKSAASKYIAGKYGLSQYILYVSRVEPRKNHSLLLKTWLDLKLYEQGISLVLLGHESGKVRELENKLHSLPADVRKYIYRSAEVDDADLLQFYRAASVFVYPSKAEGFGIPPLEAAALKLPVICSNTSAMSDFTFFGEYHIDPNDATVFKEKLSSILREPPDAETLTKISAFVGRKYSWRQAAESLYEAVIGHKTLNFGTEKI